MGDMSDMRGGRGAAGAGGAGGGEPIIIANEFVDVEVRRVHTRNGVRLEIHSPRRGTTIRLDAMVLDALTWQGPEVFSEMLRSE